MIVIPALSCAMGSFATRRQKMSESVLEISLSALSANLKSYREILKSDTKIMVMVKANAYGLGAVEVARLLANQRVDFLGVAYQKEAYELKSNGIQIPILVMNPDEDDFDGIESEGIQAAVYSLSLLKKFISSGSTTKIHLKLETGMNRLGFSEQELPKLIELLKMNPQLQVTGIFTHFSSTDLPTEDEFSRIQAEKFDRMSHAIIDALGYRAMLHALNSPGMVRFPEFQYDLVRLGIGIYGFDPSGNLDLRSVATLKTRVSQIRDIRKGESISYSRTGQAKKDMTIAVLPIGYADGYLRVFGNGKAYVSIGSATAPTVGTICMDMTIIDVTGLDVHEGSEVIIFGNDPSIAQVAEWSDTIPYEILTNVGERVKRTYIDV